MDLGARSIGRLLPVVGILASGACWPLSTQPSADEDLRLTVQISSPTVALAQSATITITLENAGEATVNLTFNSGCQVLPYVRASSTNQIVYPTSGDWACTAVLTQLSLRAGATMQRVIRVRAPATPGDADASLPPGEYQVFARLDDTRFRLQADPVSFVIQ
jgi:hypothetical protein